MKIGGPLETSSAESRVALTLKALNSLNAGTRIPNPERAG